MDMLHQLTHDVGQKQLFLDQFCAAWGSEYQQRGGTIHCGKGCSGCCSLVVNCTFPEAAVVAAALSGPQADRLREQVARIKATADRSNDLKEWLSSYRQQAGPCPFLDQAGSCSIYPVRPLSCRTLLATQPPQWCATDFSSLTSQEKQAFMALLDRSMVAFPTHYAATPQEIGQDLEEATLRQMETVYGFSLLGSLPWLVWLEQEHHLSKLLPEGRASLESYLERQGLLNQFLIIIT